MCPASPAGATAQDVPDLQPVRDQVLICTKFGFKIDAHNQFVGLVIDQRSQPFLTDERLQTWVAQIKPHLLPTLVQAA